ncbi:hypothetical protein SASPL_146203 [Salvia splendens]|uniref:Uncharacterized protein n=1 Tax=Salvia splendens TaxID=180675 RepID=A0A8X8WC94_SALSN|nr:hypothetical protein SASPL_146203 [Salvia splendens]
MEIRTSSSKEIMEDEEEKASLLSNKGLPEVDRNLIQQAISQTSSPPARPPSASRLCAFSCALLSFTDSLSDEKGNVCYGFTTFRGMWIIDGSATLPPEIATKYKLRFIDFAYAVMSLVVFAAVAMFNEKVVECLWPAPSPGTKEVGIGMLGSMFFVAFPITRHGIGFPLTSTST